MFIRDSLAEFGETAVHAGNAADREWSPNATTSNPSHESKLLQVWFDGNREAVENNTFFSPAVESGGLVKVILAARNANGHTAGSKQGCLGGWWTDSAATSSTAR